MRILRKILALTLIIIMIPVAIVGAFFISLSNTLLSPEFYKGEAFQENVYEQLTLELSKSILESNPDMDAVFTTEEIQEEIETAIPPELVSEWIGSLFEQLEQRPLPQQLKLSMVELRNNTPMVITHIFEKMAEENPKEIPPGVTVDDLTAQFMAENNPLAKIPEEILIPLDNARTNIVYVLEAQKNLLRGYISTIVVLLALVAVLVWSPAVSVVGWVSWPLFINGLLLIGLSQMGNVGLRQGAMVDENFQLASHFLTPVFIALFHYGLALGAIGLIGVIIYFILLHRDDKNTTKPSSEKTGPDRKKSKK